MSYSAWTDTFEFKILKESLQDLYAYVTTFFIQGDKIYSHIVPLTFTRWFVPDLIAQVGTSSEVETAILLD